jgi:hypothetical protein
MLAVRSRFGDPGHPNDLRLDCKLAGTLSKTFVIKSSKVHDDEFKGVEDPQMARNGKFLPKEWFIHQYVGKLIPAERKMWYRNEKVTTPEKLSRDAGYAVGYFIYSREVADMVERGDLIFVRCKRFGYY